MISLSTMTWAQKGHEDRKIGVHDGNLIRTKFHNFGSIGGPGVWNKPRIEWPAYSGHEYGYEAGLLIGAEVIGNTEDGERDTIIHIVDDGIQDGGDEDFEPLPGYANPDQDTLAFSDRPNTWPSDWDEWPGEFGSGVIVTDQESYWVMQDMANTEFQDSIGPTYYPNPEDTTLHGLGMQVSCRGYEFSDSLAEDILFGVYNIKNISPTTLDKVVVGVFGDFDIGGYPDYGDDCLSFDFTRNMIYTWDYNNQSINFEPGEDIGWLGFKMLESPKDSMGEELGLTAVTSFVYGTTYPYQDTVMWNFMTPGTFEIPGGPMDHVTVISSGYFSLPMDSSARFVVAIIMGADSSDLFINADYAQALYDTILVGVEEPGSHDIPGQLFLFQNEPNPFNSHTRIKYAIPIAGYVKITIYDIIGREIKTLVKEYKEPGLYTTAWYGDDEGGNRVTNGIYFCRMAMKGISITRKLLMIK